jgi:hypothetical protein
MCFLASGTADKASADPHAPSAEFVEKMKTRLREAEASAQPIVRSQVNISRASAEWRLSNGIAAALDQYLSNDAQSDIETQIDALELCLMDASLDAPTHTAIRWVLGDRLETAIRAGRGRTARLPTLLAERAYDVGVYHWVRNRTGSPAALVKARTHAEAAYFAELSAEDTLKAVFFRRGPRGELTGSDADEVLSALRTALRLEGAHSTARLALADLLRITQAEIESGEPLGLTLKVREVLGQITSLQKSARRGEFPASELEDRILSHVRFDADTPAELDLLSQKVLEAPSLGGDARLAVFELKKNAAVLFGRDIGGGYEIPVSARKHFKNSAVSALEIPDCSLRPPDPRCPHDP